MRTEYSILFSNSGSSNSSSKWNSGNSSRNKIYVYIIIIEKKL